MWKEKYGSGWRRQKDLLFEREEVETVSQLLAKLAGLQSRGFYFRGQPDARFKITSSIQRAWLDGESWRRRADDLCFAEFSKELVKLARDGLFAGVEKPRVMDHEIWGYLQHYCCPTPFIDFSFDPLVALHFALSHARTDEGCCSVYAMEPEEYRKSNLRDFIRLDEFLKDAYAGKANRNAPADADATSEEIRSLREAEFEYWGYLDKTAGGMTSVGGMPKDGVALFIYKDFSKWHRKAVAPRLKSQKGLFVYAPIEDESLEEFIYRKNREIKPDGKNEVFAYPRLKCLDIPGSLVEEARRSVSGAKITESSLCLDPCPEENKAKEMFGSWLNFLAGDGGL